MQPPDVGARHQTQILWTSSVCSNCWAISSAQRFTLWRNVFEVEKKYWLENYEIQSEHKSWAVPQAFNPSTWEAEAGRSLWVWGLPGLQSELQDLTPYPVLWIRSLWGRHCKSDAFPVTIRGKELYWCHQIPRSHRNCGKGQTFIVQIKMVLILTRL